MSFIPEPPFDWRCFCKKPITPVYCGANNLSVVSWNYDCSDHCYINIYTDKNIEYIIYYIDSDTNKKYKLLGYPAHTKKTRLVKVGSSDIKGIVINSFFPLPIVHNIIDPKPIVDRILKLKAYL